MRLTERWRYCPMHSESIQTRIVIIAMVWLDAQFYDIMRSYILRFSIFHWEILKAGAVFGELVFTKLERFLVVFGFQTLIRDHEQRIES